MDQMGDQILAMEGGIVDPIKGGTVKLAVTAEDQIQKMDGITVDHMEVPRIQSGV